MPNQHDSHLKNLLLELASRPCGATTSDALAYGYTKEQAGRGFTKLMNSKLVFSARLSHRSAKYFTDKELAERTATYDPASALRGNKRAKAGTGAAPAAATTAPSTIEPVKTRFNQTPLGWETEPVVIPPTAKITSIPAPAPRWQSVDLPTTPKPYFRPDGFEHKRYATRGMDRSLMQLASERASDGATPIEVDIDDL